MANMSTNVPIDVAAALRGWKQIAAYLHRDVRTVQRWERNEHLPVHRQLHLKLGTVHAVRGELDEWLADQTSPRAATQTPFPTRDPRAYELCLKGRQLFHQFRRTSFERAREMFNRAIALHPKCAIAHSGLADCCSYLYLYWEPTIDNLRLADSASPRAVLLSPGLAEAQVSRAVALSTLRNYPEAEEVFRTAIDIDPDFFEAHYFYGRACLAQGKYKEAVAPLQSACKVRAEDYQAPALLALAYTGLGRRQAAARACARAVKVAKQQLSVSPGEVRALYLGAGCLPNRPAKDRVGLGEASSRPGRQGLRRSVQRRLPLCSPGPPGGCLEVFEKSGALGMAERLDQA